MSYSPIIPPLSLTTTAYTSATGLINVDMLSGTTNGWYDTLNNYGGIYFDLFTTTTITAGAITFEQTNDTTNDAAGTSLNLQDSTVITQTNVTSYTLAASTIKHYQAPITSRYIRFRFSTALTGTGNCQATIQFKPGPYIPIVTSVSQATLGSLNGTMNMSQFGGTAVVNGGVAGVASVAGNIAAGTAPTANPLRVAGLAFTAQPTARGTGTLVDAQMTTSGAIANKPFGVPANDWTATSGTTPLATTTSTSLNAAGAAGIKNYCTGIQLFNSSTTVSTTVSILDGSTVKWTGYLPASSTTLQATPVFLVFLTPLQGTAATAMNIQCGTTAASVYYNVQGFQAP